MRVSKLLGLVPSVIQESQITAQQLTDLVDLYKDDSFLFFLEREGGGKKCEKCLTRDMTARQVRIRPRASITHSYKT